MKCSYYEFVDCFIDSVYDFDTNLWINIIVYISSNLNVKYSDI